MPGLDRRKQGAYARPHGRAVTYVCGVSGPVPAAASGVGATVIVTAAAGHDSGKRLVAHGLARREAPRRANAIVPISGGWIVVGVGPQRGDLPHHRARYDSDRPIVSTCTVWAINAQGERRSEGL